MSGAGRLIGLGFISFVEEEDMWAAYKASSANQLASDGSQSSNVKLKRFDGEKVMPSITS